MQRGLAHQRAARGEVLPEVKITLDQRGGPNRWAVIDVDSRQTLSHKRRALVGTYYEANAAAEYLEREYQFTYVRVRGQLASGVVLP